MKALAANRLVRTAGWVSITPRLIVAGLVLGAVALSAFLVLAQLARNWLVR